jgi:hypothetical protein
MHQMLKTFCYDPETKQQSQGKLWQHLKHVVDLFLLDGTVRHEFSSRGETVNQHYYWNVLLISDGTSPPKMSRKVTEHRATD